MVDFEGLTVSLYAQQGLIVLASKCILQLYIPLFLTLHSRLPTNLFQSECKDHQSKGATAPLSMPFRSSPAFRL